jgi:hypothetical protein
MGADRGRDSAISPCAAESGDDVRGVAHVTSTNIHASSDAGKTLGRDNCVCLADADDIHVAHQPRARRASRSPGRQMRARTRSFARRDRGVAVAPIRGSADARRRCREPALLRRICREIFYFDMLVRLPELPPVAAAAAQVPRGQ